MPINTTTGEITAKQALNALDGQDSGVTKALDFAVCDTDDTTKQFALDLSDADPNSTFTLKVAAGGDVTVTLPGEPGLGNVIGPNPSTDSAIARYDGTTGALIQDTPEALVGGTGTITCGDGTPSINGTAAAPELFLNRADNAVRQICLSNGENEMALYLQATGFPAVLETATSTDLAFQVDNTIWTIGCRGDNGTTTVGGYGSKNNADYVNKSPDTPSLRVLAPAGQTADVQTWEINGTGIIASLDETGAFNSAKVDATQYTSNGLTLAAAFSPTGVRLGTADTGIEITNTGVSTTDFIVISAGSDFTGKIEAFGVVEVYGASDESAGDGPGRIVFKNAAGDGGVTLKGPTSTGSTAVTYILPETDGTPGQVLSTNGSGVLSWVDNTIL